MSATEERCTVQEGEHLSAIAARYGYRTIDPIWRAAANAELRATRKDPHQLLAGDELVIPPRSGATFERLTGSVHTFVIRVEQLHLRLQVLDLRRKPVTGLTCTLRANNVEHAVTTDGDGKLSIPIAASCRSGELVVGEMHHHLDVGRLGPSSEPAQQAERLRNLGYWFGSDYDLTDPEALRLGVELFQCDHGLEPTGEADDAFLAKLEETHDGRSA